MPQRSTLKVEVEAAVAQAVAGVEEQPSPQIIEGVSLSQADGLLTQQANTNDMSCSPGLPSNSLSPRSQATKSTFRAQLLQTLCGLFFVREPPSPEQWVEERKDFAL